MKIFDFLLENKELIIANNGVFSFDTLRKIRAIMKKTVSNTFELTEEQKQIMIDAFINSKQTFNEETPDFLIMNESCIKASIARDINSINFLQSMPPNLEDYILKEAKESKFILSENSLDFIKSCYKIALNSIQLDVSSADFVLWECINEEKRNILVDELIRNGYVLSENSAEFLTKNEKVVFNSIQKSLNNFYYADSSMKKNFQIIKYLLFHDYEFSNSAICQFPLHFFESSEFMKRCLKKLDLNNSTDEKYINRISELYSDALKKLPSIYSFKSIFDTSAESEWKKYRNKYSEDYDNIFGIICAELKENDNFDDALEELKFLEIMEDTLGKEKYQILSQAMKEYFNVLHSGICDKLSKIQKSKDIISKLSALYISIAKENYMKEEIENYYDWISPYFILRENHPVIQKKLILRKQKEAFKNLYVTKNRNIIEFLEKIVQKYDKFLNKELIDKMIYEFLVYQTNTLDLIVDEPHCYSNYVRYEKATKLIRRLNSKFIEYDGVEMTNYRDIISYDETKKEYIYTGMVFDQQELMKFENYKKELDIFEKIKREIISKTKEIKVDNDIDEDWLEELAEELPFTDEYFIFDVKRLEDFNLNDLLKYACLNYEFKVNNFKSISTYHNIYQLLVNQGMIWLLLFMKNYRNRDLCDIGISPEQIAQLIDNMDKIINLSKKFDSSNFKELLLLDEISHYTKPISLEILGHEVIEKISKNQGYTNCNIENIISMATELAAQMVKRNKSTVPYIHGETANYKYSLYDSQDETLLLAGINTDACFKIDGNDNDFLHYCALDKNGFIIKITDYDNHFIARASGFRNGNCVFINQLRTIYDEGGFGYRGKYTSEQDEIIETFEKACEDIVTTSHQNNQETDKIDYVFVTKSYLLEYYTSNVSNDVESAIGSEPMDNNSEDWENFVKNTKNLQECNDEDLNYFCTDYDEYRLICMASIKEPAKISCEDIRPKNVDALYERERAPIIVTDKVDDSIMKKINKIRGIQFYFEEKEFESIEIPKQSVILTGDNWYIIYNNGKIVDFCVLDFDTKAKIEFKATSIILKEDKIADNLSHLDIDKMIDSMQIDEKEDNIKIKDLTIFK